MSASSPLTTERKEGAEMSDAKEEVIDNKNNTLIRKTNFTGDITLKNQRDLFDLLDIWEKVGQDPPLSIYDKRNILSSDLPDKIRQKYKRIFAFMEDNQISIVFPLNRNVQIQGLLLLGNKANSVAYTYQDFLLLEEI